MPKRLRKTCQIGFPSQKICDSNGNLLSRCLICMELIDQTKSRGKLDCSHDQFCFDCILNWSKVTNQCPLCKTRFKSISGEVEVEEKDQRIPSVEDWIVEIRCVVCASDLDEHIMLLCDSCDRGFHTSCLGLRHIPEVEHWYCCECLVMQPSSVQSDVWNQMLSAAQTTEKTRKRLRRLKHLE